MLLQLDLRFSLFIVLQKLFLVFLIYHITKRQDSVSLVSNICYYISVINYLTLGCHFLLQAFPDALFHQLLFAMAHPDHKTRVGAHHVFSIVLMPSAICPWLIRNGWSPLPPVASEGINSNGFSVQDESNDEPSSMDIVVRGKASRLLDNVVTQSNECLSGGQSSSFKHAMVNGKSVCHN